MYHFYFNNGLKGQDILKIARGNRDGLNQTKPLDIQNVNYVFDDRDRLTKVTEAGKVVDYRYNGDNLLYEREENGEITRYYYDGGSVIAEDTVVNNIAELKSRYIRGRGLVAQEDPYLTKSYYLHNGHGDVVELRDSTGTTRLNQYTYDIWGNPLIEKEAVNNPFRYSGELWDSTTDLQYLRARWYDPSDGRFINEDTYEGDITNPLSLNLYTYVHNNPLINVDPSGHWCESANGKWAHPGGCNGGKDGVSVNGNVGTSTWTDDKYHNNHMIIENGVYVEKYYHPISNKSSVKYEMPTVISSSEAPKEYEKVLSFSGKAGAGASAKIKILGVGAEITAVKGYNFCDSNNQCGTTMEHGIVVNISENIGAGGAISSTIYDNGKRVQEGFLGGYFQNYRVGPVFGSEPNNDIILESSIGLWIGPGAEGSIEINLSALIRNARIYFEK
jgi:RHS repeat-associated protein